VLNLEASVACAQITHPRDKSFSFALVFRAKKAFPKGKSNTNGQMFYNYVEAA
jgi:hypothetical protein